MEYFDNEFWVAIDGFEHYEISNHGRVFNNKTRRFVQHSPNSDTEVHRVSLYSDGERRQFTIPTLLGLHFFEGFKLGMHVYNVDGDHSNTHVSNFYVNTPSAVPVGDYTEKDICSRRPGRPVRVIEWDRVYKNVPMLTDAIDGHRASIYRVLRGERQSHRGLSFEWAD